MEIIIITGMSGAGKSQAVECFEDQGYYCIDNMPAALIRNFIDLSMEKQASIEKAAFVVDVRGDTAFGSLIDNVEMLKKEGVNCKVLFLEAGNNVLIRRYNETRRVHPMTRRAPTVSDIEKERGLLKDIRKSADFIIDTSNMKAAKLKNELLKIVIDKEKEETFVVNIMSFGFKYGIPINADMVFDMRFIPNPFYVPSLKKLTGNSKKVKEYVMKHIESQTFIKNLDKLINNTIPCYMREGKFHINIAFGCTGGQHRSVAMANEFAEKFQRQEKQVTLEHRDIKK